MSDDRHISDLAHHLHEWDKRHRASGRRRFRPWIQESTVRQFLLALTMGAILVVGVRLTLPPNEAHVPFPSGQVSYDPGLYTPFTRAPRPPHPISIYTLGR
jgi:hypothetical protein